MSATFGTLREGSPLFNSRGHHIGDVEYTSYVENKLWVKLHNHSDLVQLYIGDQYNHRTMLRLSPRTLEELPPGTPERIFTMKDRPR